MKETIEKRISRLKAIARKQIAGGKTERALNTVTTCALTLYSANLCYMDPELEECLEDIAAGLPRPQARGECREDSVLFYDGFGLGSRGLLRIYLEALCEKKTVTLVTRQAWLPGLSAVTALVEQSGGKVCPLAGKRKLDDILALQNIISDSGARHLFMYANADDVVVTTAFHNAPAGCVRYQVDLTDHAFWLGSRCLDKCIEFRDYGAAIAREYRQIPAEKLVKLPFYPQVDEKQEFLGYPFDFNPEKQKLVFSGGALYKTQGADNLFYRMVETMLQTHPDVVFWHAGDGDSTQLDILAEKFPRRVWHTTERPDLFALLKKCVFYLSTYPICGGLMFQYAAAAGKIPVTLKHDSITDGFLVGQQTLGIEFDTLDSVCAEISRLLTDESYRRQKETALSRAVLTPREFARHLEQLLDTGDTGFSIENALPDTRRLRQVYLENYTRKMLRRDLVRKGNAFLLPFFPVDYVLGFAQKAWAKLTKTA